jgi:hypothetical protein
LIYQAGALHVSDQRQSKQRLIPAIVTATRTGRIRRIVRPRKHFCDRAFVDAVLIDN